MVNNLELNGYCNMNIICFIKIKYVFMYENGSANKHSLTFFMFR